MRETDGVGVAYVRKAKISRENANENRCNIWSHFANVATDLNVRDVEATAIRETRSRSLVADACVRGQVAERVSRAKVLMSTAVHGAPAGIFACLPSTCMADPKGQFRVPFSRENSHTPAPGDI
uniref:Uncharacterized protein n=1 Tax=Panagrellus redivivus TaxID=6233 RepID=A0A7E4UZ34_PANRE